MALLDISPDKKDKSTKKNHNLGLQTHRGSNIINKLQGSILQDLNKHSRTIKQSRPTFTINTTKKSNEMKQTITYGSI